MKKPTLTSSVLLSLLLFAGCRQMLPELPKEVNGIPTTSLTVEDAKNFGLADTIKFYLPEQYDKDKVKTFLKNYYKDQISAEVIDYIIDTASEETANEHTQPKEAIVVRARFYEVTENALDFSRERFKIRIFWD